ncbi:MAG: TetR/AcrR family transcriptional regulator [Bacteroidota bacterium]
MPSPSQLPWIKRGYQVFAYEGPLGLKVERLAKTVGKNKSSFYYHFADLEVFTEQLLTQHLAQAKIMGEKEAACQSLEELIDIVLEHRLDLLFNRQLRIHRENPDFLACFTQVNQMTLPAFLGIWSKILDLQTHVHLAGLVLQLSMENFFLQLTDETLHREWLMGYFHQLQTLVWEFKKTGKVPGALERG